MLIRFAVPSWLERPYDAPLRTPQHIAHTWRKAEVHPLPKNYTPEQEKRTAATNFYSGKLRMDVTKFQTDRRGIEPELAERHKERST